MIALKFILTDGSQKVVEATEGHSLMEVAIAQAVPGIIAECGGSMACVTCLVRFDPFMAERLGAPDHMEDEMLDFAAAERTENSRLSCQIKVCSWKHGATITVPATQI